MDRLRVNYMNIFIMQEVIHIEENYKEKLQNEKDANKHDHKKVRQKYLNDIYFYV